MKEKITNFIINNWQAFLLMIILIFVIFQNQKLDKANRELERLKDLQNVSKILETMDKKINDIKDKDNTIYLALEEKMNNLESARKSLKEAEAKLKQPNKGEIKNENSNLNDKELNDWFLLNGIDTAIGTCK